MKIPNVVIACVVCLIASAQTESPLKLKDMSLSVKAFGKAQPAPKIPKSWRLVGVQTSRVEVSITPNEPAEQTTLWFQDADGSVVMLHGFVLPKGDFCFLPGGSRLAAE